MKLDLNERSRVLDGLLEWKSNLSTGARRGVTLNARIRTDRPMLFKYRFHQAIANGEIEVTYRAWRRARVRVGKTYRLNANGVLEVQDVHEIPVAGITDAMASAAGFASRDALFRQLFPARAGEPGATVFEVRFCYLPDPRTVVADVSAGITEDAIRGLLDRLRAMDSRSRTGPWTGGILALIEANPRVAASRLAPRLGLETVPFKRNVRKLKALGLTISHDVGYNLTSLGARVRREGERETGGPTQ